MDRIAIIDGVRQRFHFVGIHKQANMLADAILFVDHSKAHAGIALLQIYEDVGYRGTHSVDAILSTRIRAKRTGDFDGDGHDEKLLGSSC
jgi:hypothetical protein